MASSGGDSRGFRCRQAIAALAGLAVAHGIGDPLRHCRDFKTSIEKKAETNQIALGVIVKTESMESAADTRFEVGQQDVDPAKLGEIIGVTPTGYYRSVATACYDDRAEASEPIRENRAATR